MKSLLCLILSIFTLGSAKEPGSFSKANMFSLSSEEMVFASKLSDENRHRFCYTFSVKERNISMNSGDPSLLPDQKVEQLFSSLYTTIESKSYSKNIISDNSETIPKKFGYK